MHTAFVVVRHVFPSTMFAPGVARLRMSTPVVPGLLTGTWTGGLPSTRFLRTTLPWTPGTSTMPFVLPKTTLSTMTLSFVLAVTSPIPKLFPCAAYPFPLNRFARTRFRLAPAASHMPPQGAPVFPLATAVFASRSLSVDAPVTMTPEKQLVAMVTCVTSTRELAPVMMIPCPRNR